MQIKTDALRHAEHKCDLCVVGGGLSGMFAAIAAARHGTKVVLIQDRPVFGGNCSSEIRMWIRGASGLHNRETGLISELEQENIYRNPNLIYSIWDSVLFGKVKAERNIEVLMNASCCDADTDGDGNVVCVRAWQLTTYTWHTVYAKYFADCSGDSILAPIVGALWRSGREGHDEFGESIGPEKGDRKTMGMSCLIQARETDGPVSFTPPSWAYVYESDEDFGGGKFKGQIAATQDDSSKNNESHLAQGGSVSEIKGGIVKATSMSRPHKLGTSDTNFWWIELGGEYDSIHDSEMLRDELLKIAFGVWDHIKNRGDHGAENWELEWVGFLPGKRESRRYIGDHVLTQHDVEAGGKFDDIIAFGGWPMDDHNPAGIYSFKTAQPASILYPAPSPYGMPYRILYSKNVNNLFCAGRNVSATHAANSSLRVMATCALLGQAMGVAASICARDGITPREVYTTGKYREVQATLLDDGCYLPGLVREIPELSRNAKLNLDDADRELLFNGIERPDENGTVNYVTLEKGQSIVFDFGEKKMISELRLMFDPDFSRESISVNKKMKVFTQVSSRGKDFRPVKVANTLVKSFSVYADGKLAASDDNNYYALRKIFFRRKVKTLEIRFDETHGIDKIHVFSCDVK